MSAGLIISIIGLTVALLGNFGALVWGAATLKSSVKHLEEHVDRATAALENLVGQVNQNTQDIAVLKVGVKR